MKIIVIILISLAAIWFTWAQIGRHAEWDAGESPIEIVQSLQIDSLCSKNIVAIQPYMLAADYRSEKHFYEKLKSYFERAKQREYFHDNTVVILPEYIGTWLVVSGEKNSAVESETINAAMTTMVLSNPFDFIQSLFNGIDETDAFAAALFRMKAETMANQFASACKQLASEYKVTISAGSIVLPGPSVKDNTIQVNEKAPFYNVSFLFTPAGIDPQLIRKSYPISS
jgi:hypothetical protein